MKKTDIRRIIRQECRSLHESGLVDAEAYLLDDIRTMMIELGQLITKLNSGCDARRADECANIEYAFEELRKHVTRYRKHQAR